MATAIYLPYLVVAYGRVSVGIDMNAPRAMFDRLPEYAKRATWAHQNSFETFALFAAAALTDYVSNAASDKTLLYVFAFLVARFLFSLFYSFPTIEIDIQNQELALRRFAPQRLIFHWEGSMF